jgi:hypothetical protein
VMSFEFPLVGCLRWALRRDRCVVSSPMGVRRLLFDRMDCVHFCPVTCRLPLSCVYGTIDFDSVVVIVCCPSRSSVSVFSLNPDVMLG